MRGYSQLLSNANNVIKIRKKKCRISREREYTRIEFQHVNVCGACLFVHDDVHHHHQDDKEFYQFE